MSVNGVEMIVFVTGGAPPADFIMSYLSALDAAIDEANEHPS